jgi:hypothetical protein
VICDKCICGRHWREPLHRSLFLLFYSGVFCEYTTEVIKNCFFCVTRITATLIIERKKYPTVDDDDDDRQRRFETTACGASRSIIIIIIIIYETTRDINSATIC